MANKASDLISSSIITDIMILRATIIFGSLKHKPIGVVFMIFVSVIIGIGLLVAAFIPSAGESENPILGQTVGFVSMFGPILAVLGIAYLALAVGFWRANPWALKLYKRVNQATTITSIFAGALLISGPSTIDAFYTIISQLLAIMYTLEINSYLDKSVRLKSYFEKKIVEPPSSRIPTEGSPF